MHQHHDRSIVFSGSQQREKEEEGGRIHITRRTLSPPALHFVYFWFACRWCDQQYANILWVPDRTDLLMRTTNDHELILLPRPAPRAIIQLRTRGGSDGISQSGGRSTGRRDGAQRLNSMIAVVDEKPWRKSEIAFPPPIRAQLSYLSSCHFGR